MPEIKNNNLVALKEMMDNMDERVVGRIKRKLSDEAVKVIEKPTSKIVFPENIEEEIMITAATVLLPNSSFKVRELGEMLAKKCMTGIYRLFLCVKSPAYAVKQADQIWYKFYNKGKASVSHVTSNSGTFIVENYKDLRLYQIELTCGYIVAILELAGAKNVSVNLDPSDNNSWKWKINWE